MPTTGQFFAEGIGNGLSYIPEKYNVSSYDFWTTLGGTQKGNTPTEGEIALSRENAMKIHWSLSDALFTLSTTDGTDTSTISTLGPSGDPEPTERVCGELSNNSDTGGFGENNHLINVYLNPKIARYYDGATTDEANFVGYGIEFGGDPSGFGMEHALLSMEGFADNATVYYEIGGATTEDPWGLTDGETGYVVIGEIPFVYVSEAQGTTTSVSPTDTEATDTLNEAFAGGVSFDFYTYT